MIELLCTEFMGDDFLIAYLSYGVSLFAIIFFIIAFEVLKHAKHD